MNAVTLSIEDVFKGSNDRTALDAYVTPASNGLLDCLIQSIEEDKKRKMGILKPQRSAKT